MSTTPVDHLYLTLNSLMALEPSMENRFREMSLELHHLGAQVRDLKISNHVIHDTIDELSRRVSALDQRIDAVDQHVKDVDQHIKNGLSMQTKELHSLRLEVKRGAYHCSHTLRRRPTGYSTSVHPSTNGIGQSKTP